MNRKLRCVALGKSAEEAIVSDLRARGFDCVKAGKKQDLVNKVDYHVKQPRSVVYDKLQIKSEGIDASVIFLEALDVHGNIGWLFGAAALIAKVISDKEYAVFDRVAVANAAISILGLPTEQGIKECYASDVVHNQWFRRIGRKDIIAKTDINFCLEHGDGEIFQLLDWKDIKTASKIFA